MKLEDQVCSLDLAKKLKQLGVMQESFFWWETRFGKSYVVWEDYHKDIRVIDTADVRPRSAAFTVAELGEMLPAEITDDEDGTEFRLIVRRTGDGWGTAYHYVDFNEHTIIYIETAPTEADARAKMLVYLIEQKLITV